MEDGAASAGIVGDGQHEQHDQLGDGEQQVRPRPQKQSAAETSAPRRGRGQSRRAQLWFWVWTGLGAAAVVVAGWALAGALLLATSWGSAFVGEVEFTVEQCKWVDPSTDPVVSGILSQGLFRCRGDAVVFAGYEQGWVELGAVDLVAARSTTNTLPMHGSVFMAFYAVDDPRTVYAEDTNTVELSRVLLGALCWGLMLVGAVIWTSGQVLGWSQNRRISSGRTASGPREDRGEYRSRLKGAGQLWLLVGVTLVALNQWVFDRLMGTVGLG